MIVTMEQIEKGMWCPDARVRVQGGQKDRPANRLSGRDGINVDAKAFCCIGPGCMAWQWVKTNVCGYCGRAGTPLVRPDYLQEVPINTDAWVEPDEVGTAEEAQEEVPANTLSSTGKKNSKK